MSGPPVAAIIVNWKSAGDVLRLVESLLPHTADGLRFVVLENGSNDDSHEVLSSRLARPPFAGHVTYLVSPENTGFCAGVNQAVEAALSSAPRPEYLWLLNPDTHPGAHILPRLLSVAEESGAGIVSARAGPSGDGFAGEDNWPWAYFAPARFWRVRPPAGIRWWRNSRYHGGCVLFQTTLVERLRLQPGGFLPGPFFMYHDEWHVSLRARRFGEQPVIAADTFVFHDSARPNQDPRLAAARTYYLSRNAVAMARWIPPWLWPIAIPIHLARDLGWYWLRERQSLRAYLWGLADGVRGRYGIWKHHPS